ncbi:Lrp/AsnC family transcriptional regulator [soil metagenome]
MAVDDLDARILTLLAEQPRISILEISRRAGVARATVHARLQRLQSDGTVRGFGPELDTARLGYPVTAFCTVEIHQRAGHDAAADHLVGIPEVLEAYTVTGPGDLLVRVAARSNSDLQRIIDGIVADDSVVRVATTIVLRTQIRARTLPLLHAAVGD